MNYFSKKVNLKNKTEMIDFLKNHENIICLPNKVIVEVESSDDSEYDAVTN